MTVTPSSRRSPGVAQAAPGGLVILVGAIALLALQTRVDPDLWGHLRFGLDILQTQTLPTVDPYSFTQDTPWVNHEWGSELLVASAYLAGGVAGIVALKAAVIAATLALVWQQLSGYGTGLRSAMVILVAAAAHPLTTTVRPQLWTWLAVAALLWTLRTRRYGFVPVLFAVWANLHGGWIVGLGLLAGWTVGELWDVRLIRALWLAVFSVLATLLNPYGIGLWRFLADTVRLGREGIVEWQPLWTTSADVWLPWVAGCALLVWAAWRRRIAPALALACAGLAGASALVMRLEPFFVLSVVLWSAPDARAAVLRRDYRKWGVELVAATLLVLTVLSSVGARPACLTADMSWAPDFAVDFDGISGTLALPFGWGEYALWKWGPQLRVSIDGRRETVYTDKVVAPQLAVAANGSDALPYLNRLAPDFVWFPNEYRAAREWFTGHGYRIVLVTDRSFVAARDALDGVPARRQPPLCFPY